MTSVVRFFVTLSREVSSVNSSHALSVVLNVTGNSQSILTLSFISANMKVD